MNKDQDDKLYLLLKLKMEEMAVVPPQSLGPFTFLYKKIVPYFKFYPWRTAIFVSVVFSSFLYFILGKTLIRIVSILQAGF